MELRLIIKLLLRRWWLVVVPPILIAAYSLITYHAPAASYAVTLRFSVGYAPQTETASLYDRSYPAWLASEYIAGGLSDWARTGDFAQAIADDATAGGKAVTAAEVAGSIGAADHVRSIATLFFNGDDPDQLTTIATSSVHVMQQRNNVIFPQNGATGATVTPLDAVSVSAAPPSLKSRLDIPIRIGLGLVLGIVLAFVAHYFDPSLRERSEVEALGLPIIGEIPK